jgi:predicted site-specific integrase-resolvase
MVTQKRPLSLRQAAKACGIHRTTLIRWLAEGKIKASAEIILPQFTTEDIRRIKQYIAEHYYEREN